MLGDIYLSTHTHTLHCAFSMFNVPLIKCLKLHQSEKMRQLPAVQISGPQTSLRYLAENLDSPKISGKTHTQAVNSRRNRFTRK